MRLGDALATDSAGNRCRETISAYLKEAGVDLQHPAVAGKTGQSVQG
jgi:hypothetical protein